MGVSPVIYIIELYGENIFIIFIKTDPQFLYFQLNCHLLPAQQL